MVTRGNLDSNIFKENAGLGALQSPPPFFIRTMTDTISFKGNIHLINIDSELEVLSDLKSAKEIGFDTETRPSFKKGEVFKVALLQLATENDAYLIRLHSITRFESLINIFENKEVVKVGVAVRDDLKQLQKTFKFVPQNFIDLQHIAKAKGLKNLGLKNMTEEVFKKNLSKTTKMTNWESPTLTDRQMEYAATDAWIGLKLFQALKNR